MTHSWKAVIFLTGLGVIGPDTASAQEKPIVGLIPMAQKPIAFDGKLTGWDGAFITPVHVGHPDFANRGGQFLYLWDEKNLYIGLKCLDQKTAHIGTDKVRKTSTGNWKNVDGGTVLWTGNWKMFDLSPGVYTLELTATDKAGAVITSRTEKVIHENSGSK